LKHQRKVKRKIVNDLTGSNIGISTDSDTGRYPFSGVGRGSKILFPRGAREAIKE
jgi:hypothetical protein